MGGGLMASRVRLREGSLAGLGAGRRETRTPFPMPSIHACVSVSLYTRRGARVTIGLCGALFSGEVTCKCTQQFTDVIWMYVVPVKQCNSVSETWHGVNNMFSCSKRFFLTDKRRGPQLVQTLGTQPVDPHQVVCIPAKLWLCTKVTLHFGGLICFSVKWDNSGIILSWGQNESI